MSQSKPRLKTSAMIASIADEGQATVSAPFGVALSKLAAQRPAIVGMTADLSKYTDLHIFAQAFPDRFFQMGMAEQLLMGAAGGMAKEGFIPFATTYAAFATRLDNALRSPVYFTRHFQPVPVQRGLFRQRVMDINGDGFSFA